MTESSSESVSHQGAYQLTHYEERMTTSNFLHRNCRRRWLREGEERGGPEIRQGKGKVPGGSRKLFPRRHLRSGVALCRVLGGRFCATSSLFFPCGTWLLFGFLLAQQLEDAFLKKFLFRLLSASCFRLGWQVGKKPIIGAVRTFRVVFHPLVSTYVNDKSAAMACFTPFFYALQG